MSVVSTKTFLITISNDNIKKFNTNLLPYNENIEFLDPIELGKKWTETVKHPTSDKDIKEKLIFLDKVLLNKKPIKKNFWENLIETKKEDSFIKILEIEQKKDELFKKTEDLFDYFQTKKEYEFFINLKEKFANKRILVGHYLGNVEVEYTSVINKIVNGINEKTDLLLQGLKVDWQIPEFKVEKFETLEYLLLDEDEVLEHILNNNLLPESIWNLKKYFTICKNKIAKYQELYSEDLIENSYLHPLFVDEIKQLYSYLELQIILLKQHNYYFRLPHSTDKFLHVFITIKNNNLNIILPIIKDNAEFYREVDWNQEIVDWKVNPELSGFKGIAESIGTISKKESDPTPFLSFFYMLFFAFCLNDVVYGTLLAITTGYFLYFTNLKNTFRPTFKIFFYSSLFTIVLGFFTNSFAGDFFNSDLVKSWLNISDKDTFIQEFLQKFQLINVLDANSKSPINQLINPLNPIMFMLILAGVIGFLNILCGYFLKILSALKAKDYQTILMQSFYILFLISTLVYLFINNLQSLAIIFIVIGLLGMFLFNFGKNIFQKFLGLLFGTVSFWSLIGLLANIMSYTRIIAVGLTGGIIANIVNLLAFLLYDGVGGGFFGLILALLMLIIGHSFNIVLSIFGAYINPLRLTYVEFMPSFYQGNARQIKSNNLDLKYNLIF